MAKYEPQPDIDLTGCIVKLEVNLNELLLDIYNDRVLKYKVTSSNTVREIVNAFELPQGKGVNFTSTGVYVNTEDGADRCYCRCSGKREYGHFAGCHVDFTSQSDLFEINLLDLTNSDYNSSLVSLENLRNSKFANSTITTRIIIDGYFNHFDVPLGSADKPSCKCPTCPQIQTASSKRLGNFLSNLSNFSLTTLSATCLLLLTRGVPYLYHRVIE